MAASEKKWIFLIIFVSFLSLFFLRSAIIGSSAFSSFKPFHSEIVRGPSSLPAFAYYISGSRGHGDRIYRLLLAVYHPRNRYLLHLGTEASDKERAHLAAAVQAVPVMHAFENVDVLGKPDALTYMGSSVLASAIHAAAVLLKLDRKWDWFITLNAADYPLVTQDDLFHVFSSVPRHLNFIEHTSDLGWKELQRVQPIVVDPGIYLARRTKIFQASEKRPTPEAFKFFTGSPWVILSRPFIEFCILGWDNLPRTLLMYFTNVLLAEEGYFHTVICNAPEFQNTTVNADLRYIVWDTPPGMEPHFLNLTDYDDMARSGAAFARQFHEDDSVLDQVDEKILHRGPGRPVPGAWCLGRHKRWMDPCTVWGNINIVRPGLRGQKLGNSVAELLEDWSSNTSSCKT